MTEKEIKNKTVEEKAAVEQEANKELTKEEVIERLNNNFAVLDSAHGRIKVSRKFYTICACIGTVASVVGVAGIVAGGIALAPLTLGLGIASVVTSVGSYNDTKKEEKFYQNLDAKNIETAKKLKLKVITPNENEKSK